MKKKDLWQIIRQEKFNDEWYLTQNPLRDGILICHKGKGYDTENPSIYLFILRFNSVYAAFSEGLFD